MLYFLLLLIPFFSCKKATPHPNKTASNPTSSPACLTDKLELCYATAVLLASGKIKQQQGVEIDDFAKVVVGELPSHQLLVKSSEKGVNLVQTQQAKQQGQLITLFTNQLRDKELGLQNLLWLCKKGHVRACTSRGFLLLTGSTDEQHKSQAKTMFEKSCNQQSGAGCAPLAELYIKDVEPTAKQQGMAMLEKGVTAGDHHSKVAFAEHLLKANASIPPAQRDKLTKLLSSTCEQKYNPLLGFMDKQGFGHHIGRWEHMVQAKACWILYNISSTEKAPQSTKELANKRLSRACRLKHFQACKTRCEQGDGESCFDLASLYRFGKDVAQNTTLEKNNFSKACELGFKAACNTAHLYK